MLSAPVFAPVSRLTRNATPQIKDPYRGALLVTQDLGAQVQLKKWFSKMVKDQTKKHNLPGKVLNKTESNLLLVYTVVTFLENSLSIRTTQKLFSIYIKNRFKF